MKIILENEELKLNFTSDNSVLKIVTIIWSSY